ncbi:BlaI/MecI/CopY family transcriptional regulator [Parahaliea mediterranea]|uniref:BlaI/MecI/CopY family transcriptional regulator n=1 Tax=Parahaliea mediterranea TaxID=651086 RepID=UPI0013009DA6|nr:BlaI/MecI/CopY family transcriptional regulator [Parahaliea mediterranea]
MSELPELTKAEYKILNVMWGEGEFSIREVHETLDSDWALSTTKTNIERMHRKGLLHRRNLHGMNVYRPAITRPVGLARWVRFFADHVLGMDTRAVVSMFGKSENISDEELAELEKLSARLKDED